MRHGWRNDPEWVAYYEKRDKDRIDREIARVQTDMQMKMLDAEAEFAMRRLAKRCAEQGNGYGF